MTNFNENAIREAAYYIWKNNGCPANTSAQDWSAAISQLNALSAAATLKNGRKKAAASASGSKLAKAAVALKASAASKSRKMPQTVLTSKKSK
mgnify:FL=1